MGNPFEKVGNKKELLRKKEENEVENIADKLGKKIDGGIKEAVIAFRLNGFRTDGSCEGHLDWGYPYPWVDIVAPTRDDARCKELQKKYQEKRSLAPAETKEGLSFDAKIAEEEKEIENKLERLLDEFYKNRGGERLIGIKRYASWHRIQPVGVEEFKVVKSDKKLTDKEKQKRKEFLDKSQKEMESFVAFLDKKFKEN